MFSGYASVIVLADYQHEGILGGRHKSKKSTFRIKLFAADGSEAE